MSYENICFATEDNIALVTLNRPQRRNALSLSLMQELIDCLGGIGSRRDATAVDAAADEPAAGSLRNRLERPLAR